MNEILLSIEDLSKFFIHNSRKHVVLQKLNLKVYKGEILSILAPSGYGKTTLLNLIAGLTPSSEGEISLSEDIDIGYLFQKELLLPWRNVLKNILLGVEIKGKDRAVYTERAKNLLDVFGMKGTESLYPRELSGGMHQRVGLIQSLIYEPDLLLLDEPFSSLDYVGKLKLEIVLYKIIKSRKMTALLVTHDIEEAITLSDRIILFKARPLSSYDEYPVFLEEREDPARVRRSQIFTDLFSHFWKYLEK